MNLLPPVSSNPVLARCCVALSTGHQRRPKSPPWLCVSMDHRTRLSAAFRLRTPDRPPILGGWLRAPDTIREIVGCSEEAYYRKPVHWGIEAERILGSDGVIRTFHPVRRGAYRKVDQETLEARDAYTVDRVLEEIKALPDPQELQAGFDSEAAYADFIDEYDRVQSMCAPMLWCPAGWEVVPKALWYERYGFETTFTTMMRHPGEYARLIRTSAHIARQRASLHARAIADGIAPLGILTGEDLCSQQGPMVSPEFLRREYFPWVEYAIEPLQQVGAKLVWHCDGNYRKLVDDVLATGIAGLQGFQRECGMDLEWIVDLRTRDSEPLLIFGPVSVTKTMPFGTPQDVRDEVRWAMETCRDKASLVFLASNTITPDVPLVNIRAFWDAVRSSQW